MERGEVGAGEGVMQSYGDKRSISCGTELIRLLPEGTISNTDGLRQ